MSEAEFTLSGIEGKNLSVGQFFSSFPSPLRGEGWDEGESLSFWMSEAEFILSGIEGKHPTCGERLVPSEAKGNRTRVEA